MRLCFADNGDLLGDRSSTVSSHGVTAGRSVSAPRHTERR